MSFTTLRYLYCDGEACAEYADPFLTAPNPNESITAQRAQARRQGWVQRGGLDLCPECK